MSQIKELLVEELQDLLHAEGQLLAALPKMAEAAHNSKLKEAFEQHLQQTQNQVERLEKVFELLGVKAKPKPCKAMLGLVEETKETIEEGEEKEELAADLALVMAAHKVEHYEIAAYGTARALARQIGQFGVENLLTHTLREEEWADFLLSKVANLHEPVATKFKLVFNDVPPHQKDEFVSQLAEAIYNNGGQLYEASKLAMNQPWEQARPPSLKK